MNCVLALRLKSARTKSASNNFTLISFHRSFTPRVSIEATNGTVHRAAANDIDASNRAVRGSVCNGLFADHSAWSAIGSPPYGNIVIEVRPPPLRLQSSCMPLLAADETS